MALINIKTDIVMTERFIEGTWAGIYLELVERVEVA